MAESGGMVRPANMRVSSWWLSRSAVVPVIRAPRPCRCARRYLGGIAEVQSGNESGGAAAPSEDSAARSDELPDSVGAEVLRAYFCVRFIAGPPEAVPRSYYSGSQAENSLQVRGQFSSLIPFCTPGREPIRSPQACRCFRPA